MSCCEYFHPVFVWILVNYISENGLLRATEHAPTDRRVLLVMARRDWDCVSGGSRMFFSLHIIIVESKKCEFHVIKHDCLLVWHSTQTWSKRYIKSRCLNSIALGALFILSPHCARRECSYEMTHLSSKYHRTIGTMWKKKKRIWRGQT